MRLGVLCSGGKDSLFACWRAMQKEEVACLITVVSRNPESYMFHTPNIRLAALQADAAGLPLVEVVTAGVEEAELDDLARAIGIAVADYDIEGVVSGAILSVYQAARIQRICHTLGLWCFNPLWHTDQQAYMEALVDAGFGVLVSGVFSEPFDERWLGRVIDRAAIDDLRTFARTHRISLTGEGGELETFVFDAPFFSRRIEVVDAAVSYRNFRGTYRIRNARLVEK
ncbi:MAG: diphthine--ammonia ligase [Methanomicrobiaceae archaeon]|nr:diphthine--ammonia ligase [Methanomicrobiaceae archaeon]